MTKVEVPEKLHKEVKKFALEHDLSVKDAYAQLLGYTLEQKLDKAVLRKILKEKRADEIIVGS